MRGMYDGFFWFALSVIFRELCKLTGISKTRTTPFHPQYDGQTKRMNRTLLQMLRCTTIMSAYRMTIHKVTGLTPNMAMFGRAVMLPHPWLRNPRTNQSLPQFHSW